MKRPLRQGIERSLSYLPLHSQFRLAGLKLLSVYYHTSWDESPSYFRGNYQVKSPAEFERDLDLLIGNFEPVSLDEVLSGRFSAANSDRIPLFLSFDDGYRELSEIVAPLLRSKGIPATFFLTTDLIDNQDWFFEDEIGFLGARIARLAPDEKHHCRAECLLPTGLDETGFRRARRRPVEALDALWKWFELDREQVLLQCSPYLSSSQIHGLIEDGFSIGAHGTDHTLLAELPLDEQLEEVRASTRRLRAEFSLPYSVFSFPYGEFEISRSFFERAREERLVDAFFGTRGMILDEYQPFVWQRFWAENEQGELGRHLRGHLGEAALRGLRQRNQVSRRK